MSNLTYEYRLIDKACGLFYDRLRAGRSYEGGLFIPSLKNKQEVLGEYEGISSKIDALPAPDPVFEIVKEQMQNFIAAQKLNMDSLFLRPMKHVSSLINVLTALARKDCRSVDIRAGIVCGKYTQAAEMWQGVLEWLGKVEPMYLQECIFACDTLARTLNYELTQLDITFNGVKDKAALVGCISNVISLTAAWKADASSVLTKKGVVAKKETAEQDSVKFDETYYRSLLKNELGINLDELLSWYEEEVEKTRANVFNIVSRLDIPEAKPKTMGQVNQLLLKYAGPYESPQKLFSKAQEYLDRVKVECLKVIPMPEEQCLLCKIPEQIKFSYPWGGYGGGCPVRRPLTGEYYVNDFNYTAVTDGWIKMMAIHEAYGGHHVQFVRTTVDRLPEVVKIGARSIPITEGTAHRSEHIFEYIFAEDQFYPLFVAYRRHHTSVRIKAELWLRYFGKPIGDAVKLYMEELGFDHDTARGQVSAQESMQGYFNSYYYGMKKIEDMEKQSGLSRDEYTRCLFDVGRVSIELLERYLTLSDKDKHRYTNDFASLIQFEQ